jgi:hypothetical protein
MKKSRVLWSITIGILLFASFSGNANAALHSFSISAPDLTQYRSDDRCFYKWIGTGVDLRSPSEALLFETNINDEDNPINVEMRNFPPGINNGFIGSYEYDITAKPLILQSTPTDILTKGCTINDKFETFFSDTELINYNIAGSFDSSLLVSGFEANSEISLEITARYTWTDYDGFVHAYVESVYSNTFNSDFSEDIQLTINPDVFPVQSINRNSRFYVSITNRIYFWRDFSDVSPSHWAYPQIKTLAVNRITTGCGPNIYCPDDPVNRAQMAVFLERGMRGSDFNIGDFSLGILGNIFLDVSRNYWAVAWIELLYMDGITTGCGNNNYCPEDAVTREQMAVFLLRAKYGQDYQPPTPIGMFNDVDLNHWAAPWIEQLANEGITTGCGPNIYCPKDAVTRAQMAVFLVRTFGL